MTISSFHMPFSLSFSSLVYSNFLYMGVTFRKQRIGFSILDYSFVSCSVILSASVFFSVINTAFDVCIPKKYP